MSDSAVVEREASIEARISQITAIVEEQRQLLEEQRERLLVLEQRTAAGGSSSPHNGKAKRSRRDLLRLAGAAAAGAAGTVALRAAPAFANTGGNMMLGAANTADATTLLKTQTAGQVASPLFQVDNTGAGAGSLAMIVTGTNNANAAFIQAAGVGDGINILSGPTSMGAAGVRGASQMGFGVAGTTQSGIDFLAEGTGRLGQAPTAVGGAGGPAFTPGVGILELVREDDGSIWASRASAGNPVGALKAAWKRLNAVRLDAADGSGNPFVPARVLNTTNNSGTGTHVGPLLPGEIVDFGPFTNANGVPSDAIGVMGNLTAVASDANGNLSGTFPIPGWLAITPGGVSANQANPVSNVNYGGPVNAVPNFFAVGFGIGANAGKVRIQNGGNTKVHILIDLFAIFQ